MERLRNISYETNYTEQERLNRLRNAEMIREGLPVGSPRVMHETTFLGGDKERPYINRNIEIPTNIWTKESDRSWGALKDIRIRSRYPSRSARQSPLLNMFRKVFGYRF